MQAAAVAAKKISIVTATMRLPEVSLPSSAQVSNSTTDMIKPLRDENGFFPDTNTSSQLGTFDERLHVAKQA